MTHFAVFAAKRLVFVPAAVLIVVSLSFAIVNLIPSDPAREKLGSLASVQDVALERHQLGLDRSFGLRFVDYIWNLLHLDLGRSYFSERTVWSDIGLYLPNTLELIVMSLGVAVVIGVIVGTLGARFRSRPPDHAARIFITVTQSIPDFFLGLILTFVFFYLLRWAPAPTGRLGILDPIPERVTGALILDSVIRGDWAIFRSAVSHSILPVLTLGLFYSSFFAKTTRSTLGRALDANQVEFARACGLSERKVLSYAFRDARTPILTYGGILFAALIGGAAIVETVFSWGGIGQFAIDRILHLDLPEIQGFILIAGLFTLFVFLVLDILVILLDPRVSYE